MKKLFIFFFQPNDDNGAHGQTSEQGPREFYNLLFYIILLIIPEFYLSLHKFFSKNYI